MTNWIYVYVNSRDSDRDAFAYMVETEEDLQELIENIKQLDRREFKGEMHITIFRNVKPQVIKIPNK